MNGVKIRMGIEMAINNVCNSVIAIVNATALVAPINNDKNEPTHVGPVSYTHLTLPTSDLV